VPSNGALPHIVDRSSFMPASRKTPASSPTTLEPAIGSATSTVSGPAHGPDAAAVAALKQPSVQALAARQAATQALVAAMRTR
jgi:hypothetical protein